MKDASRLGFSDSSAYAAVRRAELAAALSIARVPSERAAKLEIPDQTAAFHMGEIANTLRSFLRGFDIVLTHAFEGGHPDHDAVAFAVHAACASKAPQEVYPEIIEMPFYRASDDGWILQSFEHADRFEQIVLFLSPEEIERKHRMADAHASQRLVLRHFNLDCERFRPAPEYEFGTLPNGGIVLYDRYDWGMRADQWPSLVVDAAAQLGLPTKL
jgi:LmbE family N-acetylglucosaminyl deacetylase